MQRGILRPRPRSRAPRMPGWKTLVVPGLRMPSREWRTQLSCQLVEMPAKHSMVGRLRGRFGLPPLHLILTAWSIPSMQLKRARSSELCRHGRDLWRIGAVPLLLVLGVLVSLRATPSDAPTSLALPFVLFVPVLLVLEIDLGKPGARTRISLFVFR